MVSINYATREVTCKIVYYGPGLSGKTTNLLYIHDKVPQDTKGKMISLATEADRTLYFDFLPINIGTISGFAAKFQLYTVPGQVYYNATRKLVLRGADGLVFVADSQADKMDENIESLNNMRENLAEYGYDINEMPIVIQYNKCDLPNVLPKEELDAKLNELGWPSFLGCATSGQGVFDTLKMIIKMVLDKAKKTQSGTSKTKPAEAPAAADKAPVKQEAPVAVNAVADQEVSSQPQAPPPVEQPAEGIVSDPIREPAYEADEPDLSEDTSPHPGSSMYEQNVLKDDVMIGSGGSAPQAQDAGPQLDQEIVKDSGNWSEQVDSKPEDTQQIASDQGRWDEGDDSGDRPFPGTTGKIASRGRRITVSDFQSVPETEQEENKENMQNSQADSSDSETGMPSPMMAPSNRVMKKKRGFFKRLFGMK